MKHPYLKGIKGSDMPVYLLSIREDSAEALLNGSKLYEFRRKFVDYSGQIKIFLYATAPSKQVFGEVIFGSPIVGSVDELCGLLTADSFNKQSEIRGYLHDCESAVALPVLSVRRFGRLVGLEELRKLFPNFHPPQSYLRIDNPKYLSVCNFLLELK